MLAGLLFAIEETADGAGALVATLPLAGATVVEHQARQLIAAGAGQIIVVSEAPTPELAGALRRIGRHRASVDRAADAAEAAAAVHPLARVVMLADGLVAADAVVASLAAAEGETLLVVPLADAPARFERIGGASAWAGVARIDARRLADLADLPADYAPQSTLLRLAAAAGAVTVPLSHQALVDGHAVVDGAAALAARERRMVAAAMRPRRDWFDRWIAGPVTRRLVPPLIARRVGSGAVAGVAVALAIGGVATVAFDRFGWGVSLVLAAMLVGAVAMAMAGLRDERPLALALRAAMPGVAAVTALLLGWRCDVVRGGGTALPVAIALVAATALVERSGAAPAMWWGGAASCLLVVAVATLAGWPLLGLILAALYVVATLASAIEALRRGLAAR